MDQRVRHKTCILYRINGGVNLQIGIVHTYVGRLKYFARLPVRPTLIDDDHLV